MMSLDGHRRLRLKLTAADAGSSTTLIGTMPGDELGPQGKSVCGLYTGLGLRVRVLDGSNGAVPRKACSVSSNRAEHGVVAPGNASPCSCLVAPGKIGWGLLLY